MVGLSQPEGKALELLSRRRTEKTSRPKYSLVLVLSKRTSAGGLATHTSRGVTMYTCAHMFKRTPACKDCKDFEDVHWGLNCMKPSSRSAAFSASSTLKARAHLKPLPLVNTTLTSDHMIGPDAPDSLRSTAGAVARFCGGLVLVF